jgi:uncharacterized YigZ family protein
MDESLDTYLTLSKPTEAILLKEKKSKFYGYAYPIKEEAEVKPIIELLRKQYPSANHVCYAWQLGVDDPAYRANDDGEPNNSAGMPIYGQIQSFNITNVLIAVVRIFGGTKLGVGGLISAYKNTAQLTLEQSQIKKKKIKKKFQLEFAYPEMDIVMRLIKKHQLEIDRQALELDCKMTISVRARDYKNVIEEFKSFHKIKTNDPSE